MSVDYKWANAVMDQLKGCQAENARLRDEAAAMTTAIQKIEHLEDEIARLRLTDAEREAINEAMDGYISWMDDNCLRDTPEVQAVLYRLRGLLERLG